MPTIAFLTLHDRVPWLRQTPGGDGQWGDCRFHLNAGIDRADWLVAYDEIKEPVRCAVPRSRRVLIVSEPPGMKDYSPQYLNQFGILVSPMRIAGFSGEWLQDQPALPWFLGLDMASTAPLLPCRFDYHALRSMPPPPKIPALSAVISTKSKLAKHRRRVEFVLALKQHLGDRFRLFGRGFQEIDDKAEAILPYSHHLVIENNDEDSFFTEKLADALLGWSFPLFSGCKDIGRFFDPAALVPVDIDSPDAIATIDAALRQAPPIEAIAAARLRLIDHHNVFALAARIFERPAPAAVEPPIWLKPNAYYGKLSRRLRLGWRLLAASVASRLGPRASD